ncbi:MAG TPA: hypothetical protein VEU74_11380 [Gemmatimonadales bacterium]|nr:hypothetical protein [Gemmatimonadales bacterium]
MRRAAWGAMARDLDRERRNKALVLEAFDALVNRRDFAAAEKYSSPTYIQHSVGIAPGREALFAWCAVVVHAAPRSRVFDAPRAGPEIARRPNSNVCVGGG